MNCVICKEGLYMDGLTTVVLTKGDSSIIIKGVPAQICDLCGEYTLDSATTELVMAMAKEAFDKGAEVEIRRFAA
ncbi:MAG: type II toxin-antitoxin system MqsA family antitoxin [Spirochaetales bacterium]|nr:MAG: type II toxin-antitoxin system MqsA family antitoxin [Spirochaetales bacterium]